jgi:hypothetical protein
MERRLEMVVGASGASAGQSVISGVEIRGRDLGIGGSSVSRLLLGFYVMET